MVKKQTKKIKKSVSSSKTAKTKSPVTMLSLVSTPTVASTPNIPSIASIPPSTIPIGTSSNLPSVVSGSSVQSFVSKYKTYIIILLIIVIIGVVSWLLIKNNLNKSSSSTSNTSGNKVTATTPILTNNTTTPILTNNTTTPQNKFIPTKMVSVSGSNNSGKLFAIAPNSTLLKSNDNGANWTYSTMQISISADKIETNFDGSIILVYRTKSNFYAYSTDDGNTWTNVMIPTGSLFFPQNIKMICMNYDMSFMGLIDSKFIQNPSSTPTLNNSVYPSTGITGNTYFKTPSSFWTSRSAEGEYMSINMNKEGSIILICKYNSDIILNIKTQPQNQTNTDTTTTPRPLDGYTPVFLTTTKNYWTCGTITESGDKIAMGTVKGHIWVASVSIGSDLTVVNNWTITKNTTLALGEKSWTMVKYSGDGNYLVAVESTGYIYYSKNNGTTWVQLDLPSSNWNDIFVNNSGYVIATTITNDFYTYNIQ